jgi:hypothetical protein
MGGTTFLGVLRLALAPLLLVLAQDWTGLSGSLSRVLFWVATTLAYAALQETV